MKILRSFTISVENWESLKKVQNKSNLIDSLLDEYFHRVDIEGMSEEELKRFIKIKELEKEFESKIKEAINGN